MKVSLTKYWIFLLFLILITPLFANNEAINQQLRMAYTLERSGQLESAQIIYENLYSRYPQNKVVVQRLIKNYFDQYKFSKTRQFIYLHQSQYPDQNDMDIYFVELLFRVKQPDSASVLLNQISKKVPNVLSLYLELGSRLMASRLFEDAILVYLSGREALGQKSLFAVNLSTCYQYLLEYPQAVNELLLYYETHPKQLNYIQKRVMGFPMTKSVIPKILKVLEDYISTHSEKSELLQPLIMQLLIKNNQYDDALKLSLQMEALNKSQNGAHLFMFAEQAAHAHAYDVAQEAYEQVLDQYPNYPHRNNVWLKLADVLALQKEFIQAHEKYTRAYEVRPNTNVARKALLSRGKLERDHLNRLDQAIATFHLFLQKYPQTRESGQVKIELATAYMLSGTLKEAQDILLQYLLKLNSKHPHYVNVIVNLAQLYYFQGSFSRAVSQLKELTLLNENHQALEDPKFNDGIKLMHFIQQVAMQDSMLFTSYSHCEWIIQRKEFQEAESLLDSLIAAADEKYQIYPMLLKSKMLFDLGEWDKSLNVFQLVKHKNNHPLQEEALYFSGKILYLQKHKKQAISVLELFLSRYPFSLYRDEVREMIRDLEAQEK